MPDPRFSDKLFGLQTKINSSSLGPAKLCPRYYYYTVVLGYESVVKNVHLVFGTLLHEALGKFELLRAQSVAYEPALQQVVLEALRSTWNRKLQRPWISSNEAKNRDTLIRAIVWYLDHWEPSREDFSILKLANGQPAIEMDFSFFSGFVAKSTNEPIAFIGRIDKAVSVNGKNKILDTKTTGFTLNPSFVAKFTPDNQFSFYSIAGRVVLAQPVNGLILDGVQVTPTGCSFLRGEVPREDSTLDEWLQDAHYWLAQIESWAVAQHWPMNDKACNGWTSAWSAKGGCEFRQVCAAAPPTREVWLKQSFKQRNWSISEELI